LKVIREKAPRSTSRFPGGSENINSRLMMP
jgi:hypothetical protein